MDMISDLAAVDRLASLTCTVKVLTPMVVGVPEIAPVVVLRVSPAGREPEVTDQLYGVFPPAASRVWL